MAENKKLNRIKTSVFSRSMSLAKLGVSAGLQYAQSRLKNTPFDEYVNSQAVQLARELGELKGSLMKAGQMLSVYGEHFLPPEANAILKTLQSDSPVVEWSVMQEILEKSISPEILAQIDINPEPIGSASMGQVYLAVEKHTQNKIAIKVQYPDVAKAIDSDVAALKRILSISKILPTDVDTTEIFDEIKQMLRQELDYLKEADVTEHYARLVLNDSRFKVPKVYRTYCTANVLATEYIEGLKPDHPLIQGLSQQRRNRLSHHFLDLYFKELFDWGVVQTDPHLGNYKIQIDSHGNDVLVLLDFGAVKTFSEDFLWAYRRMIKASVEDDANLFLMTTTKLGFTRPDDTKEYREQLKTICNETIEPFLTPDDPRNRNFVTSDGLYDWKKTDLPSRVVKTAMRFRNHKLRTPPRELVFLDRKTAGVFMFLSAMGAKINARALMNPYLKQLTP